MGLQRVATEKAEKTEKQKLWGQGSQEKKHVYERGISSWCQMNYGSGLGETQMPDSLQ